MKLGKFVLAYMLKNTELTIKKKSKNLFCSGQNTNPLLTQNEHKQSSNKFKVVNCVIYLIKYKLFKHFANEW